MSETGAVWALGAMSGTSLDGVDAAMILTDGQTVRAFGKTAFRAYSDAERTVLRAAFGKMDGPDVDAAAEVVEIAHAELLSRFDGADVVGFHGQTILHRPDQGRTWQIGNGQVLAEALDRPVVWDFRSTDMTLGGQGAPLAPFYHFALARHAKAAAPCAFLNLGGVGNLTWLDPRLTEAALPGACLAFDTGPANAKIDDRVSTETGARMDEGGRLTLSGAVEEATLEAMLRGEAGYFAKMPPKSLDREDFSEWGEAVSDLPLADAVATLAAGTAASVARGLEHCPVPPERLIVTGGGRHNPGLMEMIAGLAGCPVSPIEALGFDGDMIEAQAFAYLAVRVMRGLPTSAPGTTGVPSPVGGGRVSRPGIATERLAG